MDKPDILIIDDEIDYSETMRFYLKAKGYSVRCAPSGQDGVAEIRKKRPDIVFLDFLMPEMDGVETLRLIRTHDDALPVIMVTSYASDEKVNEARGLGISYVFPKADDFSLAATLIKGALEGAEEKDGEK